MNILFINQDARQRIEWREEERREKKREEERRERDSPFFY